MKYWISWSCTWLKNVQSSSHCTQVIIWSTPKYIDAWNVFRRVTRKYKTPSRWYQYLAKDISGENIDASEDSDSFRNVVMLLIDSLKDDSDLAKFCLTYLELVEFLLNTTCPLRFGSWHLYVECTRDIVPLTFAYDWFYSRYHCSSWWNVGTWSKRFARMEVDKVIETTINTDMKGRRETIIFSTNQSCVDRWTINASDLHEALTVKPKNYCHINPARIMKDEASVLSIADIYLLKFMHHFSTVEFISVSTGMIATPKLINDTNHAYHAERLPSSNIA